ncbi:hypothetical protein TsFJ059_005873 [Trichoderma semiorbis]|uniref:Uncharacterized protein n=1 Tax=Trichoderma semiorbis TaxID=1491008 RepID=A0A9P8KLH7_9HYPO|nr:hypothetical protein TsFJ059_005873 [Trichoderma semiorbis]
MQLSALLALLPLAAALPRAVEVETRSSTQDCYAAYGNCCDPTKGKGPYNEGTNLEIEACIFGRVRCTKALDECLGNATEKRSVEEAPVEARAVDNCKTNYVDCSWHCPVFEWDEFAPAFTGPCHSKCYEDYEQCTANQTEKRSLEEAPLEVRDSKDE